MTRWDLVSQALRLDAVRQAQVVAQASILRRRAGQHPRGDRLAAADRGEDRCPVAVAVRSVSIPGTEWQRAILGLGAAFQATQPPALQAAA